LLTPNYSTALWCHGKLQYKILKTSLKSNKPIKFCVTSKIKLLTHTPNSDTLTHKSDTCTEFWHIHWVLWGHGFANQFLHFCVIVSLLFFSDSLHLKKLHHVTLTLDTNLLIKWGPSLISEENKRPMGHIAHLSYIGPYLQIFPINHMYLIPFCGPNLADFHKQGFCTMSGSFHIN
jgi:hypothetical protein